MLTAPVISSTSTPLTNMDVPDAPVVYRTYLPLALNNRSDLPYKAFIPAVNAP